jgi:hypothetical protein
MKIRNKDWEDRFKEFVKPRPVLIHHNCIAYVTLFHPEPRFYNGFTDMWWRDLLDDMGDIGVSDEVLTLADPFHRFDEAMKAQSKEFLEQFLPYTCTRFLKELREHIDKEIEYSDSIDYQPELPFEEFENEQQPGVNSPDGSSDKASSCIADSPNSGSKG